MGRPLSASPLVGLISVPGRACSGGLGAKALRSDPHVGVCGQTHARWWGGAGGSKVPPGA